MAAADVPDLDDDFRQALRHSNEVFSAFKVHRMQSDMARLLTDSNGDLKPFNQWANDVLPIASHQWWGMAAHRIRHGGHSGTSGCRLAAVPTGGRRLPNLKWMPSTSPNPGADHQLFWNTVRPIKRPLLETNTGRAIDGTANARLHPPTSHALLRLLPTRQAIRSPDSIPIQELTGLCSHSRIRISPSHAAHAVSINRASGTS